MGHNQQIFIIGQGLAGSVLAYLLHRAGHDVTVVDDAHTTASSKIAAGMWNPISFVRNNEIWLARELLQSMQQVYLIMEKELNISCFHPTELVRIFPNVRAANDWDARSTRDDLSPYGLTTQDEAVHQHMTQPAGHVTIQGTGWLDVPVLLMAIRKYFETIGKLHTQHFTDDDLKATQITFPDARFIYCTGAAMKQSSLFPHIDLRALKGEVLTIAANHLPLKRMVHFRKFLIPLGEGVFKLGSTHALDFTDNEISEEGKQELLEELKTVYESEVSVTAQHAGLRPTTHDRKPVLGFLTTHPHIGCFNGFGSRGVLMVPYFAQHFIDHIAHQTPLLKEVDVARYG
ncbi:MAG: NAD(P)/FAD-dependent oxidoreductase [Flavobacteriales bacterium]